MAKFTYQGPDDEFVFRGITFVKGKAFETDDPELVQKLSCMVEFGGKALPAADITTAGPRQPNADAAQASPELAAVMAENESLRETVARLDAALDDAEARCAALEVELAAYENGEAEPEAEPEPEPESEPDPETELTPTDWRDLQWKQRVKMARDMGAEVTDVKAADAFLLEQLG